MKEDTKNVLVGNLFDDLWLDVLELSEKELNWNICYCIGVDSLKYEIKERFPNAVYHNESDFSHNKINLVSLNIPYVPVDSIILDELSQYEYMTMSMFDRFPKLSYLDRVRCYHKNIEFWISIISYYSINIVIFPIIPHTPGMYILYNICKYYNIPTVTFRVESLGPYTPVPIDEISYDSLNSIYEDYGLLKREYQENSDINLYPISKMASERINQVVGDKKIEPAHYNSKASSDADKNFYSFFGVISYKLRQIKINSGNLEINEIYSDLFDFGKIWRFLKKTLFESVIRRVKTYHLKKIYYSLCEKDVDLSADYVYFAPHYQPECTTAPLGGHFVNQELALKILAKSLPPGWKVIFKEHPSVFKTKGLFEGYKVRNKEYYMDIGSLSNVILVKDTIASKLLIENSKAVTTITGTIGTESLILGKPVITFGYAWYNGCKGVFNVKSLDECIDAIKSVEAGLKVELDLVKLFIHVYEKNAIKACMTNIALNIYGLEKNKDKYVHELLNFLNKWYSDK